MKYIVSKNAQTGTGNHKIHTIDCAKRPKTENVIDLKECLCPIEAKNRAKEYYKNVNGRKYCCRQIYYKIEIKL